MIPSILNLSEYWLVEIFSYISVPEREKLEEVCKLFQKIVLNSAFEKERTTAQDIAKVASHYPKELVRAVGGAKALYEFKLVDLTEKDEAFFYVYKEIWNPSRTVDHRLILFQIESTITSVMIKVKIEKTQKNNSSRWEWAPSLTEEGWELCDKDIDYIQRLFSRQPCGWRNQTTEGRRVKYDGQSEMILVKTTLQTPQKVKKKSDPLLKHKKNMP